MLSLTLSAAFLMSIQTADAAKRYREEPENSTSRTSSPTQAKSTVEPTLNDSPLPYDLIPLSFDPDQLPEKKWRVESPVKGGIEHCYRWQRRAVFNSQEVKIVNGQLHLIQ